MVRDACGIVSANLSLESLRVDKKKNDALLEAILPRAEIGLLLYYSQAPRVISP